MKRFMDLHIHTMHSDGTRTPSQIVAMAMEKGLTAIAIADHDSVSGINEALVAGQRLGIDVIPAVELSVGFKSFRDVHLLGYFIDHNDHKFALKLEDFRRARDLRAKAIVDKINCKLAGERKASISFDDVIDAAQGSVSRLHIARLLVDKGLARHVQDAFTRYLQPCDIPKQYFPVAEAMAEIRRLGGVSVLAHPQSISVDRNILKTLITDLTEMGLDGLEVFNNYCYKDDMIFLENLCRELGLAMTGGSDFHGFEDDVEIGIGRGGLAVAYRLLEPLRSIASNRNLSNDIEIHSPQDHHH
jgi:3',5'-nucleoside bisphosphate phosphatase